MLRSLLARMGYLAIAAVYGAVGFLAARVAFLGARDRVAGMPGALRFILRQPHGVFLLWAVVAGLIAFAIWRFMEAAFSRRAALARIGFALSGAGYAGLAWSGFALVARVSAGRGREVRRATLEWILSQPWGSNAVILVGMGIVASGLVQLYQAASGRLPERLSASRMGRPAAKIMTRVARGGLAARALVFMLVGYFLIRAAQERDPSEFHEIGGALRLLSRTPLGPYLMGIVGLGLIAFAVYMATLALFRRG